MVAVIDVLLNGRHAPLSPPSPRPPLLQVRALLLVDSAAITVLNAAVLAGDLGGLGGSPGSAASIAAGANVIVALCALTLAVLLGGFCWHAFKGAGAEQAGIEVAQRAAAAARFRAPEATAAVVGVAPGDAPAEPPPAAAPSTVSRRLLGDDFDDPFSAEAAVARQGAAAAAAAAPLRAGPRASIAAGGFATTTTVRRPQQSSAGRRPPASG